MTEYEVAISFEGEVPIEVKAEDEIDALDAANFEFTRSPLAHEAEVWGEATTETPLPNGKYKALMDFAGENEYIVEASDEKDARKKALALFKEKSNCFPYVTQYNVCRVGVYIEHVCED